MKVLIADDSKGSRDVLRYLIVKYKPSQIFEASNGVEALDIIRNNRIDVLITDIKMPLMDGIELIEQARKLLPELQIVLFSAFGNFEYAKRVLPFGVTNYLLKPINAEEFNKTMRTVSERFDELREKDIWNYFDETVSQSVPSNAPLPPALAEYSSLILLSPCSDHSIIPEQISEQIGTISHFTVKAYRDGAVLLLGGSPEQEDFKRLYDRISRNLPCSCFAGFFMQSHVSLSDTWRLLITAKEEHRFWEMPESLCFPEPFDRPSIELSPFFEQARNLGKSFFQNNVSFEKQLDTLMGNARNAGLSAKQARLVFSELLKQISMNFRLPQPYEQIVESVHTAKNLTEIRNILLSITESIEQTEKANEDDGEFSPITQSALSIIHAEYMNNLDRNAVAGRIFVSSAYFSHIFKKETGKKFTEYLNDYRMTQACKLLSHTTHSIHSIAKMVGFTNYPYFCSQFKKQYGQTCIQYREAHFKEGD